MIYLLRLLGNIFIIKNCDFDIRYYDKLPIYYNFTSDYLTTDNKLNNCKILPEQVWQLVLSSIWHLSYMDFVLTFNSPSRPKKKNKQQQLKLAKRENKFLIMLIFVSAKKQKKITYYKFVSIELGAWKTGQNSYTVVTGTISMRNPNKNLYLIHKMCKKFRQHPLYSVFVFFWRFPLFSLGNSIWHFCSGTVWTGTQR